MSFRLGAGLAQSFGLGFAASFSHSFCEIRKKDGEPKPERDLQCKTQALSSRVMCCIPYKLGRGHDRADLNNEHDRILEHRAWMKLAKRVANRTHKNSFIAECARLRVRESSHSQSERFACGH